MTDGESTFEGELMIRFFIASLMIAGIAACAQAPQRAPQSVQSSPQHALTRLQFQRKMIVTNPLSRTDDRVIATSYCRVTSSLKPGETVVFPAGSSLQVHTYRVEETRGLTKLTVQFHPLRGKNYAMDCTFPRALFNTVEGTLGMEFQSIFLVYLKTFNNGVASPEGTAAESAASIAP